MAPEHPEFDPWGDTDDETSQARDDAVTTSAEEEFGASPEMLGIPNPGHGATGSGHRGSGLARAVAFAMLALVVIGVVAGTITWLF